MFIDIRHRPIIEVGARDTLLWCVYAKFPGDFQQTLRQERAVVFSSIMVGAVFGSERGPHVKS